MARSFYAIYDGQELEIILDPTVSESYVSKNLVQDFENSDIGLDSNGDYFLKMHFTIEDEQGKTADLYKDLTIVDDEDCEYQICLGDDFISSDQVTLLTDTAMVIANLEAYALITIPTYDC